MLNDYMGTTFNMPGISTFQALSAASSTGTKNKTSKAKPALIMTVFLVLNLAIQMLPGFVWAFHEGGVGYCEGCHVMHRPAEGQTRQTNDVADSEHIAPKLRGSDPSSTCLRCHAAAGEYYNVMSKDGSSFTPAGDFYWLRKMFVWKADLKSYRSEGDKHGHNVVALDYGLNPDRVRSSAPGGVYPSAAMGCTSCHNPHGKITCSGSERNAISVSGSFKQPPSPKTTTGSFRLLGGKDYTAGGHSSGIRFESPAPIAVASPANWAETDTNHTAYGDGMSEWCSNCHPGFIDGGRRHPVGKNARLSSNIVTNYNAYIKTGDLEGTQAAAYLSIVPVELGITARAALDPSNTSGPDAGGRAQVMCLTCHRPHASAFQSAGRWDFEATCISESHPRPGDGGVTGNDVYNSYYGRDMVADFGKYQRQFCNKCHVLD